MGKWDFLEPYDAQVHSALATGDVKQAFEILLQGYQGVVVQFCTTLLAPMQPTGRTWRRRCLWPCGEGCRAISGRRSCGRGFFALPVIGVANTGTGGAARRPSARARPARQGQSPLPRRKTRIKTRSTPCAHNNSCTDWSAVCPSSLTTIDSSS
jgi:hypothetical protein